MKQPIYALAGVSVYKRGGRLFAVPKRLSLTDRIATRTQCRGNWSELPQHGTTARVVRNHK